MANMSKMFVLTKMEELDAYAHKALIQFPKYERHVLCAEIRTAMAEVIKLTIREGKRFYKKTTLQDLDIQIEYMRVMIRKAHTLGYISPQRYKVWTGHLNEIGAMVGSWIKKNVK